MPFKEYSTVSQRAEFCQLAHQEGANRSELCRRFKISRMTGYKWLEL
jgi:transposase-like protein